jgi:hypothetical protein
VEWLAVRRAVDHDLLRLRSSEGQDLSAIGL